MIYDSVQYLKNNLQDNCYIFPTHGSKSDLKKLIKNNSLSTVKDLKQTNWLITDNLKKRRIYKINKF